LSATQTVRIVVHEVNAAPTISASRPSHQRRHGHRPVGLHHRDAETAAASLTLTRDSTNTTLVPLATLSWRQRLQPHRDRDPATNQFGTTLITVTVSDGSATASETFLLTVNPVNDAPTISTLADQVINEDTSTARWPSPSATRKPPPPA